MPTVLKIGGSILEPEPAPELLNAIVERVVAGDPLVLVHGGRKALTAMLKRLDVATRFVRGLRVTDAATLEAALMVLAGSVNKKLVAGLNAVAAETRGASDAAFRAVGLSGVDGNCVQARVADPELGYVGQVTGGDARLLTALLAARFTPVVASIAGDGVGGALNVNADQFACAVAQLIVADRLVFITDVAGVLDAEGTRIATLTIDELDEMAATGTVAGGMLPKLAACREALAAGVGEVEIVGAEAALNLCGWEARDCPGTRVLAGAAIEGRR